MIAKLSPQLTNQIKLFGLSAFVLFLAANLQITQYQKITEKTLSKKTYVKEESQELRLSFLRKMPAFGFDNLIADWSMLKFLQYFGDGDARKQTGYSLSPDFLEIIVDRDPLFVRAYTVISPVSSLFAGRPDRTVELMNKGLSKMPANIDKAYYVWIYKGVDEILFLGDLEEARKSYKQASVWADISGNEMIAKSANNTAEFLASKPDAREAQVGAWFMVWNNNKDERIRQLAKAKIESIGGELKVYPDGRVEAIPPKSS